MKSVPDLFSTITPGITAEITRKQYGPYMRNGKQFWRNYHRTIKRKDAKSFLEVQYLSLPTEMLPLFNQRKKEPSE